jgi:uncharacterized protein YndB with AHSA1/START domain
MTSWWPAEHHIGSAPIEEVVIEPYAGGRWYTRHTDGTETYTGVVTAWDPPGRLVVTWQIGADWKFHADLVTSVELRFTPEGPGRTRVELEHRDLDRHRSLHTPQTRPASMRGRRASRPAMWTATIPTA